MTVAELIEQAKLLTPDERKELAKQLIDMIDTIPAKTAKTGKEIVNYLKNNPAIEFVDNHIDDPVEWVTAQREKRQNFLQSFQDNEE